MSIYTPRPLPPSDGASEALRDGLLSCLQRLAEGFLNHPENAELRRRLTSEASPSQRRAVEDLHGQLLLIACRLLFLLVAKNRGLPVSRSLAARLDGDLLTTWQQWAGCGEGRGEFGLRWQDGSIELEAIGSIYESLLDLQPVVQPGPSGSWELRLLPAKGRKHSGSYYTPTPLIQELLRSTLAPLIRRRLAEGGGPASKERRLLALRVCDPACGSGHFLLAAARYLGQAVARIRSGKKDPSESVVQAAVADVIRHCIRGVDKNPPAVVLCRSLLWLEAGLPDFPWEALERQIRRGDSLSSDCGTDEQPTGIDWPRAFPDVFGADGFDAVLGNPPYGTVLSRPERNRLAARFPEVSSARNAAAYFAALAQRLVRADGYVGLVLPKSLTYSHAWRGTRSFLLPRVLSAMDAGRAWSDVRLEQVLLTWRGSPLDAETPARVGRLPATGRGKRTTLDKTLASRLDIIPTGLTEQDHELLARIAPACSDTLASICSTRRGTGLQRQLRPSGTLPVIGGREISEFRSPEPRGFVEPDQLAATPLRIARPPQVVFQNIIAHLTRPADHLRLIGTVVTRERACLDTVNLLEIHREGVSPHALCGLLMSDLVNWFVYTCVYNRAIRTMHFDGYFLSKILIPESDCLDDLLDVATGLHAAPHSAECWRALNERVYELYEVPVELREYVTAMHKPRWL